MKKEEATNFLHKKEKKGEPVSATLREVRDM